MSKHHYWSICQAWFLGALLCACSLALPCAPALAQTEDEIAEDLIVAVSYDPYLLSGGLLAAYKDGEAYLPVMELADTLDFYVEPELERGYISGFLRDEANSYAIDAEKGQYEIKGDVRALPEGAVLRDPFGEGYTDLYVRADILSEIWPVDLALDLSNLVINVTTEEKLPFELRLEREAKQAINEGKNASRQPRKDLPFVPNPYKWLGRPAVDIETEQSLLATGDRITRTTINGVQDVAKASMDYTATFTVENGQFERPDSIRTRFTREAFGDETLPLKLKRIEAGDVNIKMRDLIGSGVNGRGAVVSSFATRQDAEFDEITIEGTGTPGWDVEVYRNEQLVVFGAVDETGEYRFENFPLNFGNNLIRIVLYGPQGQIQERIENYQIGGNMISPGETRYSGGFVDADRPFFQLTNKPRTQPRGVARELSVTRGISERVTVFGSTSAMPVNGEDGEEQKTYATAGVAASLPGGIGQAEFYKEAGGGNALDMRYLTQIKGLRLSLQSALFHDFQSEEAGFGENTKTYEGEARANTTIRTFLGSIGLQVNAHHVERKQGLPQSDISISQSLSKGSLRFGHQTTTNFNDYNHVTTSGQINATARIKRWQFRSDLGYTSYPVAEVTNLNGEIRFSDANGFSTALTAQHDFQTSTYGAGFQIGYDFKKFLGSLDLAWVKEGGLDVLLRASSSLGPYGRDGKYIVSSERLSRAAPVQGRIFMDHDGDGVFTEGDEPVPGANISVGGSSRNNDMDDSGIVLATGAAEEVVNIEVDPGSLEDPYMRPLVPGYSTVLRPGSMPAFDFPIIETGSIDGTVMRDDGSEVQGMRLELVNDKGEVVQTTETAYDGFYTFEFVPPGTYAVRADPSYGVNVPPETVTVTSEDLFNYGIDLQLLEQATEAETVEDVEAQTEEVDAPAAEEAVTEGKSGGVAHTYHEAKNGTLEPAPQPTTEGELSAFVKQVRIGEHPDKIRLVMDLSGPIAYRVTGQEDGKTIAVDLPGVGWEAITHWRSLGTPILENFVLESLPGGGTRVVLTGKGPMAVGLNGVLKPDGGQGYRLYLDLQAAP